VDKLPEFYEPNRVGKIFYPDKAVIAAQAAKAKLPPAAASRLKIKLLIVDMQIDFCHESGALYVPGAQEDLRRLINFIYQHAEYITDIICSFDSHLPYQIFHPAWWIDREGNHPPPFTIITHEDVIDRRWRPLLEQQCSIL
jgi:nicotinamidase/pyrazinamidase